MEKSTLNSVCSCCLEKRSNATVGLKVARCVDPFACLVMSSCRTATLDFFFDLAESKVAVFLCSILTSDGIPFCFGKNSFL